MPLITLKEALEYAQENNCAIPAFNIDNMEGVQALISAAEQENNYPIILSIGQGAILDGKLYTLAMVVRYMAQHTDVPLVIHLDHGKDYEQVINCLCAGFTSVMIDGSHLPLEENISLTQRVVAAASAVGVSVEAELGAIGGTEDNLSVDESKAALVNVEEVKIFTSRVKVDALAVGIGNAHGLYIGEPKLDFDCLQRVTQATDIPLVLHGGSGIPDSMIKKSIALGMRKINVATEIRHAYIRGLMEEKEAMEIYAMSGAGKKQIVALARQKIQLFKNRD